MKKIVISKEFKISCIIWLITFCIQTTDLKIGYIKISEFILLLLTPLFLFKKVNKFLIYFFIFFTIELVLALLITYGHEFDHLGRSVIKAPYIISLGRYAELVSCITLGCIGYSLFQKYPKESQNSIKRLVNINIYITAAIVFVYFMVLLRIIPMDKSIVVYAEYRLKGFYVEGGPYGLMLMFIFMLTSFLEKSKSRLFKQFFLFIVIVLFAKSKAGFLCLLVWIFLQNFSYLKVKLKAFLYPILIVGLIGFYFAFTAISYMYVEKLDKIRKEVRLRPNDPNLIMGRLSGFYIAPNMIKENPVFGIGLGNYPLLRNNKEYRGFFPLPDKTILDADASGFGGIIDIVIDMGIVGLLVFMYLNYLIVKRLFGKNKGVVLQLGFLILFLFGVQLYFSYPWAFLGVILAYQNNYIDEISN
jgi:hypothetical protein